MIWNQSHPHENNHIDSKQNKEAVWEAFVNDMLTEKLDDIQEFDPKVTHKVMEDMHHSELARIFENADERDLLTVCYVAVRRSPVKYLTVLMDYLLEKEEK